MARVFLKSVNITRRIPVSSPKARQQVEKVNKQIISAAKREVPYKVGWRPKDAPHIRDSFESTVRLRGHFYEGVVSNTAPHAAAVHNGAKRHYIPLAPKDGPPYLTFYWENRGRWFIRGRQVDHPGQQANPFMIRAARSLGFTVDEQHFS